MALALLVGQAPPEDQAVREAKALQGQWRIVAAELNGQKPDLSREPTSRITIAGDHLSAGEQCFTFKLDVAADPRLIDFTPLNGPDQGKVLEGIYRLRGDALTVCFFWGNGIRSRPTAFAAAAGSGCALFE